MAVILDHPLLKRQCVYQLCSVPTSCSNLLWVTLTQVILRFIHWFPVFFVAFQSFEKRHVDAQQPSFVKSMDNILRPTQLLSLYISMCIYSIFFSLKPDLLPVLVFNTRIFLRRNFRIPWHHATELRGHGGLSTWWLVSTEFLYYRCLSIRFFQGTF